MIRSIAMDPGTPQHFVEAEKRLISAPFLSE
jgi:hypothetical protein